MARRKIGKIKEVSINISDYNYLINGVSGIGKTTTVVEIGQKEYGVDGFLLLTVGKEPEPTHIGNVWSERATDWDDLEEIIDTIYEYKNEDYPSLRMLGIDSVDEVFRLGEKKVIELHNKRVKPADRVDTIRKCFGGYNAGESKVVDLVSDLLFKLKDIGISLFFIGHTKQKNKKDLMTDIEFEQITSNLDNKYYNCIKDKVNIVMCAYMERELIDLETMKDAFTKKQKQVGKIASEKRVVSFRDEEYAIDVKSHLEFIVPKCDLNSDIIIHELKEAMKKGAKKFTPNVTDKELEEKSIKDSEEQKVKAPTEKKVTKEQNEAKLTKIRDNMAKLKLSDVQIIMTKYGVTSLADADSIPNEFLDELLELI